VCLKERGGGGREIKKKQRKMGRSEGDGKQKEMEK